MFKRVAFQIAEAMTENINLNKLVFKFLKKVTHHRSTVLKMVRTSNSIYVSNQQFMLNQCLSVMSSMLVHFILHTYLIILSIHS